MEVPFDALILVAGAAPQVRESAVQLLASAGYRVTAVQTGLDCVRLARERGPDAVLIETPLPDLDALEICRRLRSNPATVSSCLLVVTENGSPAANFPGLTDALAAGADELLYRPLGDRELLTEVRAALRIRRAESARHQIEGGFRQFAEHSDQAIWLEDLDPGKVIYLSPAYERITGWPRRRVYEEPRAWMEAVHPEDRATARSMFEGGIKDRIEGKWRIVRPDGSIRWVRVCAFPICDPKGRPYRAAGTIEDITGLELAGQTLRGCEMRFRALFEKNPLPMWLYDCDSLRILEVNEAAIAHYGYSQPEFLGMQIKDLFDPDERPRLERSLQGPYPRETTTTEWRHLLKDGRRIDVEITWHEIREEGTRRAAAVVAHDITARKQANETCSLLSSIVESSDDAIIGKTLDGIIVSWNRGAAELYGYAGEEVIGRPVALLEPPDRMGETGAIIDKLCRGERIRRFETERVDKDGRRISVALTVSPMYDAEGWISGASAIARDITDLIASRKALQESEERYRLLFDLTPIPMFVHDAQTHAFLAVNEEMVRHYGYSRQELLSMTLKDIRPDEEYERLRRWLSVFSGKPEAFINAGCWKHRKKDGSLIEVEIFAHTVTFNGRQAFLVVANDITERRSAEDALRASEERYRSLVAATSSVVWTSNAEGLVESLPPSWGNYTGQSPEESRGLGWVKAIHPDDRQQVLEAWRQARANRSLYEAQGRIWHAPSQRYRYFVNRGVPILNDDGSVREWVGSLDDMEDGMKAEEALRASEVRYRELFENANDVIYTSDLQGNFTSANKAAERITGYTREEILSKNLSDVVSPEYLEVPGRTLKRKLEGQESTFYDLEIVAKDGRRIALEMNTRLIYQGDEPVAVQGIGRDVTERHKLEQQFRMAQKMEAVGLLAGGIAHDFNNMLSVIIGRGELMLDGADLPPELRTSIEEILKAGKRAAALTRQLLAFSRRQVMEPKTLDLNLVVADMEKLLRRLLGEDIELAACLEPHLGHVKADLGQIEQVIMNLAVNARDAMPGGGKLTIGTSNADLDGHYPGQSHAQQAGPYVLLSVTDTGTGMPPEVLQRVFEPFFTTKEKGKGTGLGLATVYGIVKQSGGYIWVYSEPGRGSTFKVYLPRVQPPEEALAPVPVLPDLPRGSETVLLVEDELGLRQVARQFLTYCGYTTLEAGDAEEALRLARGYHGAIHLLLTDVVLPHMSGPQVAQCLRAEVPGLKVLYMSGYADDAVRNHGVIEPGAAFLQKPFTRGTLARKLREVLGKDRPQEGQRGGEGLAPGPSQPGH